MPSNYPDDFDVFPIPNSTAKANESAQIGRTHAELHRDVGAAIEAIEATLGLNPEGVYSTVAERLQFIVGDGEGEDPGDGITEVEMNAAIAAAISTHSQDGEPHPAYDDIPDLVDLFEAGLL